MRRRDGFFASPPPDCGLCPRLCAFRAQNRQALPEYFNAPVPGFGAQEAGLLIVGLAPGLQGANRTGRPFTGDYAGLVLYGALLKHGFAEGDYHPEDMTRDRLRLKNCRITNAVRCVPPQNKPEPSEIRQCNAFLKAEIGAMEALKLILTLGHIAHNAVLAALGQRKSRFPFKHGALHQPACEKGEVVLLNSYHCSRYNMNTGVLTEAMFDAVMRKAHVFLEGS